MYFMEPKSRKGSWVALKFIFILQIRKIGIIENKQLFQGFSPCQSLYPFPYPEAE